MVTTCVLWTIFSVLGSRRTLLELFSDLDPNSRTLRLPSPRELDAANAVTTSPQTRA